MSASEWIALIGVVSGLFAFGVGLFQYRSVQKWKKAEFVANEISDFKSQVSVKSVMKMLDWSERDIVLFPERDKTEDQIVSYTDTLLKSALTIHPLYEAPNYTLEEIRIRDMFDEFFDYLSKFEHFIQAGLVTSADFQPYLRYWIKRIGESSGWKRSDVIETIWIYIDFYGFPSVQSLFKRYNYNIVPDKSYLTRDDDTKTAMSKA